ncbi:MAG TPA: ribonucleoside-diphosphate reductase subunit alpha [Candidatus Paceibacterota bacterium]|nr:ribonucleoside-diphosphate reductase subunit alpha [Candidatus Paceibacterota bacterium]
MAITQKIKKRNGEIVDFQPEKITIAVKKAFAAVVGDAHDADAADISRAVADAVDAKFAGTLLLPTVEEIQDLVENAIATRGYFAVAKAYIIYRYEHEKIRQEEREEIAEKITENALLVTKRDGKTEPFSESKLTRTLLRAASGFDRIIDVPAIIARVRQEMHENIQTKDIHEVLIMVTRSFIERDPAYSFVAARLLLQSIYTQALGEFDYARLEEAYRDGFISAIKEGVAVGQFDPELLKFDLPRLAEALQPERDRDFKYLGLQTLQANYLSKVHSTRKLLETPQIFWMRVAMGCALAEKTQEERNAQALEFYEIMSAMYYMPSSPTLYHGGLVHPQLSSCFLSTVPDDLHQIFNEYKDNAQLLKYAGGTGTDWTPVRATGSLIKSTGVESQGVIPFLKIANDVTISINRSGRRRGAAAVYLEYWHADIEDFMELKKNTGDERRRAHDLNTATWIPDLFMKRLKEDGYWTLFSPSDVPDLHDLYGRKFEARYKEYEKMAEEGNMPMFKKVRASELWKKHLTMLFETGHPWITWKDPSNVRSPQDHVGVVHSSNLCTEITLNSSAEETAVCNLGSINMSAFVRDGRFDRDLVARVVPVAMRMLDNVIDVNFYPTVKTKASNMKHRPVGLGLRGLQDALYKMNINFNSDEAVKFSDESQEVISYHAILSSSLLAKERGTYESYPGSKWSRGILPQDTIALLEQERGTKIDVPRHETLDWRLVREAVRQWGMRNSNTMAHAPTATTANIAGCYPTIEPIYKNLYVKSNMAGDYMVVNEFLVEDLKKLGLWNADMLERIKFHDGSVQAIAEIPPAIRDKYKDVFEIEPAWLIKAAAYRGRWIDQSQSLNIFYGGVSGKVLSDIYQYAWDMGLKTTYYLRTMGASRIEKSTVNMQKFGGTSSMETSVASNSGSVASTVVIEETVIASVTRERDPLLSEASAAQKSVLSPLSIASNVMVEARELSNAPEPLAKAPTAAPAAEFKPAPAPAPIVSSGIPSFGGQPTVPANRPKVEMIGEVCESCSA